MLKRELAIRGWRNCEVSPYRWSGHELYDGIVAAEETSGGIGDPDIVRKRLSDALYHNAYMRDVLVAATVADHLARAFGSGSGSVSGSDGSPSATS